jgi:acetylornithine deacetylase
MLKQNPTSQDCIDILEKLVSFDTTSRNSNLQLIEFVRGELEAIDVPCRLTFNEAGNKANLWATIGPDIENGVVLSGHTDVVPVDGQDWSSPPFTLTKRDAQLFGRGTCDMKGFVACALAHAKRMSEANLKVPIHYAFSYDEEVGCTGVQGLIKDLRENLPAPLAVIVGEPTSMQIVGAHKGGHSYTTTVHGLDGHSSAPDLGVNAIFHAARIINFIGQLGQRLKAGSDPDNGFTPHYTTIDCGLIQGGTAHNIIPAVCSFSWGFRNIPGDDTHAYANEVFRFIEEEIEPEMKAVSNNAGVTHEERHYLPAMTPDEQSPAETLLRHLTGLNQSGRVAYGTEAAHFQNAGVPGVIFGPGSIEQAHLPDEYIDVSQMEACHNFMIKLADWAAESGQVV